MHQRFFGRYQLPFFFTLIKNFPLYLVSVLLLCGLAGQALAVPLVTITGPGNVTYTANRVPTVNVLVTGTVRENSKKAIIKSISIIDNSQEILNVDDSNVSVQVPLSVGVHRLQISAISGLNEEETSGSSGVMTVTIVPATNEPPVAAIASPASGASYLTPPGTSASVVVNGSASYVYGKVSRLEVLDNGAVISSASSSNINAPVALAIGSHSLQLRATSESGVTGVSAAATVNVSAANVAPTASISQPGSGMVFGASNGSAVINVVGAGSDSDGSVVKLELIDNGTVIGAASVNGANMNTNVALAMGIHTLQVRATDNSGATGTSAPVVVTVAATPVARLSSPTAGASYETPAGTSATVNVVGTATQQDGNIVKLELLDGGAVLATSNGASINTVLSLPIGSHRLQLRATSNVGTIGVSAETPVTITAVNKPQIGNLRDTNYQVLSGDMNGDGRPDILMKALPKVVMLPLDDDMDFPLVIPARTPSFILLSNSDGTYTLVSAPDAAQLAFAGWAPANYQLVFNDAGSVTIQGTTIDQGNFNVAMSAATGQLALSGNTAPPTAAITSHLANADAGTLPGALAVSNSGSATYAMELVVPPGSNGMQPALSLSYSSQGQNGPLGLGWSLGGVSGIHRCGKTIAQDGVNDRISFSTSDRLCLDGQRLVLSNRPLTDDNYWAAGAQYRTEIESFARITAESNGPGGALSFRVESRDGRISTYGAAADSSVKAIIGKVNSGAFAPQPLPKNSPQSWAIDRVTDRVGNFIAYAYDQDGVTGEHHVSFIRYGGAGQAPHAAVQFVYEARKDAWKRYIDETRNDLRSRVAHIKTYVGDNLTDVIAGGTLVRDYALSYEQSPTSGRSLLTSVGVCARNPDTGGSDCLPPTVFSWGKPVKSPGFISRGMWPGAPILTTYALKGPDGNIVRGANHADYFAFSDFDHDGYTDVLEKRVASMVPFDLNTSDGLVRESTNPIKPGTMQRQYRYFHNNGRGFDLYSYQISTGEPFVVMDLGDFNGDGALDVLIWSASGNKICLSPLGQPGSLGAPGSMITFNCGRDLPAAWSNTPSGRSYVFDPRGDGRSAVYSDISRSKTAVFCTLDACQTDSNPPPMLGLDSRYPFDPYNGSTDFAAFEYTSFTQMVDFAGTGRPHDVRWTEPFFQEYTYDGIEKIKTDTWYNLTPQVTMNSLNMPGAQVGSMVPYTYGDSNGNTNPGTLRGFYTFDKPYQGNGLSADFNGSGYTGLAFGFIRIDWYNNVAFNASAETTLCLSTGRALDCGVRRKYSGDQYRAVSAVGNFVGDGMAAILTQPLAPVPNARPMPSGAIEMCRVMGDDTTGGTGTADDNMVCTPWPGLSLPEDSGTAAYDKVYFLDLLGTGRTQLVYYHSGKFINGWQEDGRWEVFEAIDVAADGQALDRIVSVKNGLGGTASVEYVDGLSSGVVSSTGLTYTYPQQASNQPGKVVRSLTVSNGVAENQRTSYQYQDAGVDVNGRGALGYRSVVTTDEQTGKVSTTTYSQAWQTVGKPLTSRTVIAGCEILNTSNTITNREMALANGAKTNFPIVEQTQTTRHDLNCADLGVTTVSSKYEDGWGNLTQQDVVSTGAGASFGTTMTAAFRNDEVRWLIGLPTSSTVKKTTPSLSNQEARTTSSVFDDATGLRTKDITEPGDSRYQLTTEYSRLGNPFGLVNKATQQWTNAAGATQTRVLSDTTYDAKGRYPVVVKNALGHTQTLSYYPETGARKSLLDPNGLTTTWTADGFGRVRVERHADGNEVRSYFKSCQGDCPLDAVVAQISETLHGNARVVVPTVVYSDSAGHVLRTMSWGLNGSTILTDQRYDRRGRLVASDWPRFEQAPAYVQSTLEYDLFDRVTSTTTFDEAGAAHASTISPDGYVTTVTNVLGQTRVETRNVLGQTKSVTDANQQITKFDYEAFGALSKTTDPNGNVITVEYDRLGRKTHLRDPDLGHIEYVVDAPGRTVAQISPKLRALQKAATFVFDDLDRMTARFESDLESHWIFDTVDKGVGQLAQAYTQTGPVVDYRRSHTYDAYGRPFVTTQLLSDGSYTSKTEYDDWGRLLRQTYQRKTDVTKVFDYRYSSTGYMASVMRGNLALWTLKEQDAQGRPTQVVFGNGLTQVQSYNPYTSRLKNATVTTPAGVARLQEGYDYDLVGSVLNRAQYWDAGGFQESFHYDVLNRLDTSTVLGQATQSFSYDNAGNLKSKTGVGSYAYPAQGAGAIRPHAVQSTAANGAFQYDDNGNLSSGAGRTLTWTSFDMPATITGQGASASFVYGPEHQRTRQDRGDGSVVVYAGAQEVESKGGLVTVKTYWPNGLGVEIDRPNVAVTELNWTHLDRLGSPVALTDQNGVIREKLAYDAWGKRRTLDGSATPNNLDGQVDNRGFTGHEMLDQLDLVHMNGRVYDPLVGRFVSGDPLVSDPVNGQSYNRYSYVLNNPTNLTDPTGFAEIDPNAMGEEKYSYMSPDYLRKCCLVEEGSKRDDKAGNAQENRANDGKGGGSEKNQPISANTPGKVGDASGGPNPCAGKSGCVWVPGKRESYDRNDVRGGFDEHGNSLVYNPRFYNPTAASKVLILGAFNVATVAAPILRAPRAAQTFYRAMSAEHYAELVATGKLAATGETFISPTLGFSQGYDGVVVQFTMERGALSALENIGVRNASSLTEAAYGSMPLVEKGWAGANAFFKAEGGQINIGLGNGKALETFNSYIKAFSEVK